MIISEFKKGATVTKFNTNNGWGFGGSIGKEYTKGDLTLIEGEWCYRHTKAESYTKYYISGNTLTKEQFESII